MSLKDYYGSYYSSNDASIQNTIDLNNQFLMNAVVEAAKISKKICQKRSVDRSANGEFQKNNYARFKEAVQPYLQFGWEIIYFEPIKNVPFFNCDEYKADAVCCSKLAMPLKGDGLAPLLINKYSGNCMMFRFKINAHEFCSIQEVQQYKASIIEFFHLKKTYDVDKSRLTFTIDNIVSYTYGLNIKGFDSFESSPYYRFYRVFNYYDKTTEELFRYSENCPWLISSLKDVNVGKTKVQSKLTTFLGLSKVELRYYLEQPDETEFIFYLITRKHANISVQEASRLLNKVKKITEKYELDAEYDDRNIKPVALVGMKGKIIAKTSNFPKILNGYFQNGYKNFFTVSTYVNYLISEKKKNPTISLSQLETELNDFNRMANRVMDTKKMILPYNIIKAHDSMVINFQEIMGDKLQGGKKLNEQTYRLIKKYNDAYDYFEDDTYIMTHPYAPKDLHFEGASLNHCVGSYVDNVLSGRCRIFFLRKKSCPEKPLMTVELINSRIGQFQGIGRRRPTDSEYDFAEAWLKSRNYKYQVWTKSKNKEFIILNDRAKEFVKSHEEHINLTAEEKELKTKEIINSINSISTFDQNVVESVI